MCVCVCLVLFNFICNVALWDHHQGRFHHKDASQYPRRKLQLPPFLSHLLIPGNNESFLYLYSFAISRILYKLNKTVTVCDLSILLFFFFFFPLSSAKFPWGPSKLCLSVVHFSCWMYLVYLNIHLPRDIWTTSSLLETTGQFFCKKFVVGIFGMNSIETSPFEFVLSGSTWSQYTLLLVIVHLT